MHFSEASICKGMEVQVAGQFEMCGKIKKKIPSKNISGNREATEGGGF